MPGPVRAKSMKRPGVITVEKQLDDIFASAYNGGLSGLLVDPNITDPAAGPGNLYRPVHCRPAQPKPSANREFPLLQHQQGHSRVFRLPRVLLAG